MNSFRDVLRAGLKIAESPDAAKYAFKPGDTEHLRRWLNDKQAAAVFAKLTNRKKLTHVIVDHIFAVLRTRQLAQDTDRLNATFAEFKRGRPRLARKERRNAMVQFADGKVSEQALNAYLAHIDTFKSGAILGDLDPYFLPKSNPY